MRLRGVILLSASINKTQPAFSDRPGTVALRKAAHNSPPVLIPAATLFDAVRPFRPGRLRREFWRAGLGQARGLFTYLMLFENRLGYMFFQILHERFAYRTSKQPQHHAPPSILVIYYNNSNFYLMNEKFT